MRVSVAPRAAFSRSRRWRCSCCSAVIAASSRALSSVSLREILQVREVAAQPGDDPGARPGDVGEVVQLPRDLVRVLAVEQELQRFGPPADVVVVEQAREERLLLLQRALAAPGLGAHLGEPRVHLARLRRQLAQRAVRVGDGALGLLQGVDGLALRFLGVGEAFLQRVDAAAQFPQLLFLFRAGGRRGAASAAGAAARREEQDRGARAGSRERDEGPAGHLGRLRRAPSWRAASARRPAARRRRRPAPGARRRAAARGSACARCAPARSRCRAWFPRCRDRR